MCVKSAMWLRVLGDDTPNSWRRVQALDIAEFLAECGPELQSCVSCRARFRNIVPHQ